MNKVNEASAKKGRKRRAKLVKRYLALKAEHGRHAMGLLANEEGCSYQRISWLLAKAWKD